MMCARVSVTAGLLFFMCVCLKEQAIEGCSCYPAHPQQLFCAANAVMKAEVLEKQIIDGPDDFSPLIQYKIRVIKVFKGPEYEGIQYAFTNHFSGMCGVDLDIGEYLLSGHVSNGNLSVSMCDLVGSWDRLSGTQESVFHCFQEGCDCEICSYDSCSESADQCYWSSDYDYGGPFVLNKEDFDSACKRHSNGSCVWQAVV